MLKFHSPAYVTSETLRRDTAEAERYAEGIQQRVDNSKGLAFELPHACLPSSEGAKKIIFDQLRADGWDSCWNNFGKGGYKIFPLEVKAA